VSSADQDGAARFGVLLEVPVKLRALHSGDAHEFADIGSLIGCPEQSDPQRIICV